MHQPVYFTALPIHVRGGIKNVSRQVANREQYKYAHTVKGSPNLHKSVCQRHLVCIGSCATVYILTPCVPHLQFYCEQQLRTKNERESLCETGKSATETFGMILQVNGHAAMSPARSFQWNERQNITGR